MNHRAVNKNEYGRQREQGKKQRVGCATVYAGWATVLADEIIPNPTLMKCIGKKEKKERVQNGNKGDKQCSITRFLLTIQSYTSQQLC